jgi:hypothetical protein
VVAKEKGNKKKAEGLQSVREGDKEEMKEQT